MRKKHTLLNCSPGALTLPAGLPLCLLGAETLQPAHASCCSPAQSREAPELQVIPPLPRNAEPIARLWEGLPRHEVRPRAARAPQAACRLAVAAGAGARFLLGVGGARAAAEAAGERAHVPRLRPARCASTGLRACPRGGSRGERLRRLWDCAPPSPHRGGRRRPRASLGGTRVPACCTGSPTLRPPRSSRHSAARTSAGAVTRRRAALRVPSPRSAAPLPALPRAGPRRGRRWPGAQHEPRPPARGEQRLPGHHGGEEQGARPGGATGTRAGAMVEAGCPLRTLGGGMVDLGCPCGGSAGRST